MKFWELYAYYGSLNYWFGKPPINSAFHIKLTNMFIGCVFVFRPVFCILVSATVPV